MPRPRPLTLALVVCAACTGDIFTGSRPGQSPGGGGTGGGTDTETPITVVMSAPQVRVLSGAEYRATVRDLLGLDVTTPLTQSDWTAGYDNGANIHVDDNLLHALTDEAESLATRYLAGKGRTDFPCFDPANVTDACMRTVIEQLGRKAHRRPLTPAQADELLVFFRSVATATTDRLLAAQTLVARLLTSPQFLYRAEVGRPTTPNGDLYALDQFERASLVAYTLTGTMPDEQLLRDAEAGLLDESGIRRHVRRLWGAAPTRRRVGDFFRQWLKVTRLDEMAQKPAAYPKLTTPALGASLKAEFDGYVGSVVFDGTGTVPALFSESFTIADSNTAPLYGLPTPAAPARLALDPKERKGVLTLASTMAAIASHEFPDKDRPVVRGLMVKEQLLCEEVGPPSNVNTVAAQMTAMQTPNFADLTTREQYEAMMQQGSECKACHRQFMPLGFALGRYDGLGRHRVEQRGRPVNAAVSDVPFAGEVRGFAGGTELADALAQNRRTAECFAQNFVSFTVGAAHTQHSDTLSGSLVQQAGKGPLAIARFVEDLLASEHLYLRRGLPYVEPMTGGTGGGSGAGGGSGTGSGGGGGSQATRTVLLASGSRLNGDDEVRSQDGQFRLQYQLDGNLVLYRIGGGPLWSSRTPGTSVGNTSMQGDGNLVVYDRDNVPRFHASTHGNAGAQLYIDGAGKLFIVAPDGRELWNSGGTP